MPVLFSLLMILCVTGFIFHYIFLKRMKMKFPEIWQELGKPTLFLNNTIQNGLRVQKFLIRREYRTLSDENFIRFCDRLRLFGFGYLLFFGFYIVIFLFSTI